MSTHVSNQKKLNNEQRRFVMQRIAAGDTNSAINDHLFEANAPQVTDQTFSYYRRSVRAYAVKAERNLEAIQSGFADRVKRIKTLSRFMEDLECRLEGRLKDHPDVPRMPVPSDTFNDLLKVFIASCAQMDKLMEPLEEQERLYVQRAEDAARREQVAAQNAAPRFNIQKMLADAMRQYIIDNGLATEEQLLEDERKMGLLPPGSLPDDVEDALDLENEG